MSEPLILALDNGTQSVRALLFDPEGNLVLASRVPIEPYQAPHPGWAEQDAEYYWNALCQACQALWRQAERRDSGEQVRQRITGVALTTQRSTVINVDRDGKPLRPAIVWLDQRRTAGLAPVSGRWGLMFRLVGMTETVAYLQSEAEANWIRTQQPEIWDATHKYLFLSGYLTYRLVGDYVDSVGCQVGYIPFDYKRLAWGAPSDWKWQAVPMDPAILPRLTPPASELGRISQIAAEATGIPAGTPLIAAAADKACEVIGAGCVAPQMGCLSYGTTATINSTHTRYTEVIPLIPPYPAGVPDAYSLEIQVYRGFWMVSWFKQQFGHLEQQMAEELGVAPEALFDQLVEQAPPGAMGLMLQPYWSPGVRVPGPEAKGAIIGFGDVHTRAHFYRAIIEGLAFALREGKERIEKRTGIPITGLRVAGGGSQSDAAMQVTADVFGLPTARSHVYETSGLGAAMDAAVGLRIHSDFDQAVKRMTRIARVFEPDPATREMYESLYHRVYKQMYTQLRPLYEAIREITGYPPPLA
jgi:sugar (pentulose or hexulose) kinase